MINILIPCSGNKFSNLSTLINSIDNQSVNTDVSCFFLEDQISNEFRSELESISKNSKNKFLVENFHGKRLYGLFNVCRFLNDLSRSEKNHDSIIAIIDCDDFLWGNDCLENVLKEHEKGADVVWTGNELKGLGVNFSAPLNENVNVYKHPWVCSHLKTFKLKRYISVDPKNFLDQSGDWFKSCYDQALMLPILNNTIESGGKTKYIDKVHYIYNGSLTPDPNSEYRKSQLENESFIRSRGYIKS